MRNRTLDVVKLFAALMVVFIHIPFYGQVGKLFDALARFAVPLFFLISGYFCYSEKPSDIGRKIPKKILHILKIFIATCFLYFLWQCYKYQNIQDINEWLIRNFSKENIINFLLYNKVYVRAHIWYLPALIYCYVMFYFVNKYNLYRFAYYSIPVLLGIHLILGEGLSAYEVHTSVMKIRNFLFMGFPFFMLGNLIRRKETFIKKHMKSNVLLISMILFGFALIIMERKLTDKNELYFGAIIVAVGLLIFALNNKNLKINETIADIGAKCTLFIYVTHPLVGDMFKMIEKSYKLQNNLVWGYTKPLLVSLSVVVGAILYNQLLALLGKSLSNNNRSNIKLDKKAS